MEATLSKAAAWDSVIADIWEDYADARYDRKFQALKDNFGGRIWGCGDYS